MRNPDDYAAHSWTDYEQDRREWERRERARNENARVWWLIGSLALAALVILSTM